MRETELALTQGSGPAEAPASFGVDLWDRANDRSLVNLVPRTVAAHLEQAQASRPDLFNLDEKALKRAVSPSPTDNRLRLAFWMEYDRAQSTQKSMNITQVYSGICSRQYFEDKYLKTPERVSWLACQPHAYSLIMEEALAYGIERLREILDLPMISSSGKVDTRAAELILKTVALLDQRVKGAVVQRAEVRSLNVNMNSAASSLEQKMLTGNVEEMEARLKYLEKREQEALNLMTKKPKEVAVDAEVVQDPRV